MTTLDLFLWHSGLVAWSLAGVIGMLHIGEALIEWVLARLKAKREFLMWVAARYRDRQRNSG